MNAEFFNALDMLQAEKGIPKEYMLERVEAALASAIKKEIGATGKVRIMLDPIKKDMKVFQQRDVVEEVTDPICEISVEDAKSISKRHKLGGVVEIELKTKNFSRLSAQAAKQVIIQGIREAERNMMIKAYESKKEEVVTATVDKIDETNGCVILDTGTSRAALIASEQIPGEKFTVGDKVKVFITSVSTGEQTGPLVTLSRIHPGLVKRLLELEIPEIQDGTVVIKGVAREAGARSKVAVFSTDDTVDPIGACIGNRGMRIATIVEELRGEKIDVVKYSENAEEFVSSALSPANVISVDYDGDRACAVKVQPDQLSLAIGKEGQNARLAARLTGFKIDIKA